MSYELSAAQWQRVEGFLPGRPGWVGVTAKDNRTLVNGGPRFHEGRLCGCCAAVLSGKTCPPGVRQLEKRPQTFHPLGQVWDLGEDLPSVAG